MPTGRCIDGMATVNHGQPPSPVALRGWPLVTLAWYTRAVRGSLPYLDAVAARSSDEFG
jgi:hypothetical protein